MPGEGKNIVIQPSDRVMKAFGKLIHAKTWDVKKPLAAMKMTVQAILEKKATGPEKLYRTWHIDKGGGRKRTIEAPEETLKFIQGEVLDVLNAIRLPEGVYGFRPGWGVPRGVRNMLTTLEQARPKKPLASLYSTDITDFFPSVTQEQAQERVYHMLFRLLHRWKKGPKLSIATVQGLAELIAELCTVHGRLPQGAPTSPVLANMAGVQFDRPIKKLLPDTQVYGRYADDIVILGVESLPEETKGLITSIVASCGFTLSHKKTETRDHEPFPVWGVHVYSKKNDDGEIDLLFKLPSRDEREWASEILELTSCADLPTDGHDFLTDKRVLKILGYLSHAYAVTQYGAKTWGTISDQVALPPKLSHAWGHFQKRFKDRLPETADMWFKRKPIKYKKLKEAIEVNAEIFQKRVQKMIEVRKGDAEQWRQLIDTKKSEILAAFTKAKGKDRRVVDYAYADMISEFTLEDDAADSNGQIRLERHGGDAEKIREIIENTAATLIAFVELHFEGELKKMDWKGKSTLLTEELENAWNSFWECLIASLDKKEPKDFSVARGLKYLFKREETTVHYEPVFATPEDMIPSRSKSYALLPGFRK